jgi:hypothetical protein
MEEQRDYSQDLAEIRSMMERSSKFLSLSGLAGVMAGIYAIAGAWIAYSVLDVSPRDFSSGYTQSVSGSSNLTQLILLALLILMLAIGTAIGFSYRKANKRGESIWNATSKRLLGSISVPLFTGGFLVMILLAKNSIGLIMPITLIFYGLALYNASKFSYEEVKYLGMIQIVLGLLSVWFSVYGLLFWVVGFGAAHIVYGIFIHMRYER